MQLLTVDIVNYQSVKKVSVEFTPACRVLVGINESCKSNGWTWSKLYRALGAPPDIIRYYRAKEIALEQERTSHATDAKLAIAEQKGFNPQIAFEQAYASLPSVIAIPGTEPPAAI